MYVPNLSETFNPQSNLMFGHMLECKKIYVSRKVRLRDRKVAFNRLSKKSLHDASYETHRKLPAELFNQHTISIFQPLPLISLHNSELHF